MRATPDDETPVLRVLQEQVLVAPLTQCDDVRKLLEHSNACTIQAETDRMQLLRNSCGFVGPFMPSLEFAIVDRMDCSVNQTCMGCMLEHV